jgi:predicted nucleic acid-binding protein
MPRPEIFDSSVLIPYFSRGAHRMEVRESIDRGRMRVSSLVALELYAGTRSAAEKRVLDEFFAYFARRGWSMTAAHDDHTLSGQLLARRRRIVGEMAVRDHLIDVLIVVSAARVGGTVITANVRHMEPWAALARRAGRNVRVRPPLEVVER